MLDSQRNGLHLLCFAAQRTIPTSVRTVSYCISRKIISAAHVILSSIVRAVCGQLNTRYVIPTLVAVDTLIKGLAVDLSVNDLILIEKVLVAARLDLAAELQAELLIIIGIALDIIRHRHLNLVLLFIDREVQPFGVVDVYVQTVILPLVCLIRITILHKADDLYLSVLVKGIVSDIKGLPIHGGRCQVIQHLGMIKAAAVIRRIGGGTKDSQESHQHHRHSGHAEQRSFYCSRVHQNSITS